MMAVSKRLRYEILRRDNHACRYCGAAAPDVKVVVDHVVPVALGGSDEPSNLVTACWDCNSGKSASPADAPVVDDVRQKAVVWASAIEAAAEARRVAADGRRARNEQFEAAWNRLRPHQFRACALPTGWRDSLDQFERAGLAPSDLIDLIPAAMNSPAASKWRYFCGCAWNVIRELQDDALRIVDELQQEGI
ncbi:hypothetical protein GS854_01625 [Rhodococcus hoagii]|nr:hypothetical protein [Prescottella equi]